MIQTDGYKEIIKESDEAELFILSDMDNFDYNNFNLEWLTMCTGGLLQKMAHNEKVRNNISRIYAEKIENGEISVQLLRIYFKYFVNVEK